MLMMSESLGNFYPVFKMFTSKSCTRSYVINPLNTKRRPLYLKTQSVPRSKHFFISVIKTNQFML